MDETSKEEKLHLATMELREKFSKEVQENPDVYDRTDINKILEEDYYCHRFICHQRGNPEKALDMVKSSLKWRKEFGVNDIKESDFEPELFEMKGLFPYFKDNDGNENLILLVKLLSKEASKQTELRRFFVYWVEILDKRSNKKGINLILNCTLAGLKNFDMDMIHFMNNLFTVYYPYLSNSIIVFDMPWLFNAVWGIVKSWLPAAYVKRIKFVNKSSILELMDASCLPILMGGTNSYEYEHVPTRTST